MSEGTEPEAAEDIVEDVLLDGTLRVRQPRRGHKAGTDAVLLAAAADAAPGEVFVDVGAGSGVVGLAIALRQPASRGWLVDIDPRLAALAQGNAVLNGVADRLGAACLDITNAPARRSAGLDNSATLVVSNPPFHAAGSVRPSPRPQKATSHVLAPGSGHGTWLVHAAKVLRPHGRLVLIHRPEALPSLLEGCAGRLGDVRLRAVHARAGEPAIRILFQGKKGARGALAILAPLILHDADGRFTPDGEAVHRGAAMPLQTSRSRSQATGFL